MAKIFLKKKISDRIAEGHPWVYKNEIGDVVGDIMPGDIVEVFSSNGSFVGKGYLNPASQIAIRFLTRRQEDIDDIFIREKINKAWRYRLQLGYVENCRIVFAEADELPGLIIDKFGAYFVVQISTMGMERFKEAIVSALQAIFPVKGIYERSDVPVRTLEGLSLKKGFLSEPFDTLVPIIGNGLEIMADLADGEKTGYYLDRQDHKHWIKQLAKDKEVLDAFCYTGSFALLAARSGAKKVWGIDYAPEAVALAQKNAILNQLDDICTFSCKNAFDLLKIWAKEGRQLDMVILDPPALMRHKDELEKASAAYKEINLRAMKLLRKGGFLVTCCHTHLIASDRFLEIIQEAARDAKKQIKQVTLQYQSADHPVRWDLPGTRYLKFLILQVQ